TGFCGGIKSVGISRRLQRIQKPAQRIKLLVAVAIEMRGIGKPVHQCEITEPVEGVGSLNQRDVSHQIAYGTLNYDAGVIEMTPVGNTDQVGNLRRRKETEVHPSRHAGRYR